MGQLGVEDSHFRALGDLGGLLNSLSLVGFLTNSHRLRVKES